MQNTHPSPRDASAATQKVQARMLEEMRSFIGASLADAERGFIAPLPDNGRVMDIDGSRPVLDLPRLDFLNGERAEDTVNPSLWRQSSLLLRHGLFKVTERLYQVRGIGSHISFIEGDSGLIVVDSGMSLAIAQTALELYFAHRPRRPVVAMIVSHPHGDHYGGMRSLIDEKDLKAGKVKIYAPQDYLKELVSESLLAGTAMRRRSGYMFGMFLPIGPKGNAGIGIGTANARGRRAMLIPTDYITDDGQTLHIDGLDFEFQLARDVEAPVELNWYIPQLRALTVSENCEQSMHNTYTLRGAKTRNPLLWSKMIQEVIDRWGDKAEVLYNCHTWPVWGRENIARYLALARDGYRFINDETLRMANQGCTGDEIGDALRFPPDLDRHWAMRGHYGSLSHNAKGTYSYYLGWFDGVPARLNPLPPAEAAVRYVEYMGGASAVLQRARVDFEKGEYRWVAEAVNHLVFAEPDNREARELLADAYEQMGYQAEAAPWRNIYLTGAMELRLGVKKLPVPPDFSEDGLTADLLADYISIRLNGLAAGHLKSVFNITLADGARATFYLSNGTLSHSLGRHASEADADISISLSLLGKLAFSVITLDEALSQGARIKGNHQAFADMLAAMEHFEPWFNIVTP